MKKKILGDLWRPNLVRENRAWAISFATVSIHQRPPIYIRICQFYFPTYLFTTNFYTEFKMRKVNLWSFFKSEKMGKSIFQDFGM